MSQSYPYVLVNGKIGNLLDAIGNAAKPPRFSYEFLKHLGFGSSNDRAFVSMFRHLGLIDQNGAPTDLFDEVRDATKRSFALGDAIRSAYPELFAINTSIHKATEADIKAAISRTTGKDAEYVNRATKTFKALVNLAKFDGPSSRKQVAAEPVVDEQAGGGSTSDVDPLAAERKVRIGVPSLNYNIEIHLPATTDISVYNAIFRSLRDTLDIH